jgi:hypothetical protein
MIKKKFTERSINSIDMIKISKFFRFRKNPQKAMKNIKLANNKKNINAILS